MFDFYDMFYKAGYLAIEKLEEAAAVGVLTKKEFKEITGEVYAA